MRSPPCTPDEIRRAEEQGDKLLTWQAAHTYYKRFGKCGSDADAAEGISDSIARLLANHWDTLPELAKLTGSERQFLEFVLGGINATDGTKDLAEIRSKSVPLNCPAGLLRLCSKIHKQAVKALKNDEQ